MLFNKTPATINQQIDILLQRGCVINDREYAEQCLTRINYYRLAYYFAPFLEHKGKYKDGTTFEQIMRIYDFDRMLRRLIMTYLEEIEIAFRALISNYHAMKYGALGYLNPSGFDPHHNHQAFMSKIERLMEVNEKEDFVKHHKNKYGGIMPVWAAMELFSFGTLTYFFIDMKAADKKELMSRSFDLNYRTVEDRLLCLSDLRNACAHYTRLFANPFTNAPKSADDLGFEPDNTLKTYLAVTRSLYPDKSKWENEFIPTIEGLIHEYDMLKYMDGYGWKTEE
ncbi:MAG: Abi family protein [Ruminiclostridium sp.]